MIQKDVARTFGISQMTVSRILNNKPGVSRTLKKRVLSYIREQGFLTNRIASSLLVPSVSYSFFPAITDKVEEVCRNRRYYPIFYHTGESYTQTAEGVKLLLELKVSGLIITPPFGTQKEIYTELIRKNIPFVFIDRYVPGIENSFVITDTEKGGYDAITHLIDFGHRNIVFIAGPKETSSAREIYQGYLKGIRKNGLKEVVLEGGFEEKDGYRVAKKMLQNGIKPTAIMAVNDPTAIGVLQAFNEAKIRVPEDVSLTGFCDIEIASKISVPLTTVREDPETIGEKATNMLLRMIEEKKRIIERIRLKPQLIVRKSTRKI